MRVFCTPEYTDQCLWNEKNGERGLSLKVDKIHLTYVTGIIFSLKFRLYILIEFLEKIYLILPSGGCVF